MRKCAVRCRILFLILAAYVATVGCAHQTQRNTSDFSAKQKPAKQEEQGKLAAIQRLARQGNAEAQVELGLMHYNGEGMPQSYDKALELFKKAAEQGNDIAQVVLGTIYTNGRGVPKNEDDGVKWYRKAAEQGNAQARKSLDSRQKTPQFYAENRKAAERGDAEAQYNLGRLYEDGFWGVPKNETKAVEWYRKAANQGHAGAQSGLGFIYAAGRGEVKESLTIGQSAPAGQPSQRYVVTTKTRTEPSIKDVGWYRKAAEQGDAEAQNNLGVMYANGQRVPKNEAKAAEWFQKAAEQGYVDAQFNLGIVYANGQGVPKNEAKAVEWYNKAVAQGHTPALFNLGVIYYGATQIPRDSRKACSLWNLAGERGHQDAITNHNRLCNR